AVLIATHTVKRDYQRIRLGFVVSRGHEHLIRLEGVVYFRAISFFELAAARAEWVAAGVKGVQRRSCFLECGEKVEPLKADLARVCQLEQRQPIFRGWQRRQERVSVLCLESLLNLRRTRPGRCIVRCKTAFDMNVSVLDYWLGTLGLKTHCDAIVSSFDIRH